MKGVIPLSTLVLLSCNLAMAQDYSSRHTGIYFGASAGSAELNNNTFERLSNHGFSNDETTSGYQIHIGYNFTPNVGLELSYTDFGDYTSEISLPVQGSTLQEDIETGIEGTGLALVGKMPVTRGFSFYTKAGIISWESTTLDVASMDDETFMELEFQAEGTDPFFGLGAEYNLGRSAIRSEYTRYSLADGDESFQIDMFSLSLSYLF
ncbi:outer membrane beta-barrel protein [Halomonas sp. M4R1S46]|uniref:outer membrane beta-barrel protein n=1 Tax=Halomonas sp. M4R1S46 TaxID=2982692 RepID=UPI0021E3A0AB|nr:outer membrane beta-barrel protein [Halomonas sp. M4R1S46]UYG07438.1 outer membrane beta-barrel protein [Halomonas sp. M4R1S46]